MLQQRIHPRIPVSVTAQVSIALPEGRTTRAEKIANMSLGGVFVEMRGPPPFGTELGLDFKLGAEGQHIRCKGFVVWVLKIEDQPQDRREGCGVRLMGLSISEMKSLQEFINSRLPTGS